MGKKQPTIEESLKRLEEIVHLLEGEQTAINVAVELYKEGMELAKGCRKELEKAEQTVTSLISEMESGETDEI